MADIIKSGLVVFNADKTKFLVTKNSNPNVPHWLMPGGKIEDGETPEDALVREIKEELDCDLDRASLAFVAAYDAPAAGKPGKLLHISLYTGVFTGEPKATSEIRELGWLTKEDIHNPAASEAIRAYIIPDLVRRGLLK